VIPVAVAGIPQVFEWCASHGYEFDFERNEDDLNKPLCYRNEVKALGIFEVLPLCGRGDPVRLEDKGYCSSCSFFSGKK
jgi:hypothetical protein